MNLLKAFLILSTLVSFSASANKMDIETHTLVIEKIEGVLKDSQKKPEQNLSIILRLADLLAERARLKYMAEMDQKCDSCLGSKADRESAIRHYQSITPFVEGDVGATVLMQTAHLYQMLGNTKAAKNLYSQIIKERKKRSALVVAQAFTGLAHLEFQLGEFDNALKNYNNALAIKEAPQKGYLVYRKAWCLLNTGKTRQAVRQMEGLLKDDALLDVSGGMDLVANRTFQEDVSKDFASFLAREPISEKVIQTLDLISPDTVKKANLFYLGTEAERVGQKQAALLVWSFYTQRDDVSVEEKLEIQTRRAQIHLDLNQKKSALAQYQEAMKLWQTNQCKDAVDCEGIAQRLRNFPISWNRLEKKNPTAMIHSAYRAYVQAFTADFEMHNWAAQVARNLNMYREAAEDYKNAALAAKAQVQSSNPETKKLATKILEGALLANIEMAELDGNIGLRRSAYQFYLSENPSGSKSDEIKYQLAHLDYEEKNYQKASYQFKALADESKIDAKIRLKAADLSLDSLALLGDHTRLESWPLEYLKNFPGRKVEYTKISRKASLNLIAAIVNKKDSSTSDLKNAHTKIKGFSAADLDTKERMAYWKNRLLLAEKTQDLSDIHVAAQNLLKMKDVSVSDKNWAQSLQVFAHELVLEFQKAYAIAKKTDFPGLSRDEKTLKLAILADLAGQKSIAKNHYEEFIEETNSVRKANIVRLKLISQSKSPWNQLERELGKLRRTPDLLAVSALETFARFTNYKNAEAILKSQPAITKYPEGKTLQRFVLVKEYNDFDKKMKNHKLSSSTQNQLQKSLKERLKLINDSEKWVARAAKTGDWTLQVITLERLENEYTRLYNQVMKLPVPKGLTSEQRQQYLTLLAQQAEPFKVKAQAVGTKAQEFWSNSKAIDSLSKDLEAADVHSRKLVIDELQLLQSRAPSNMKSRLAQVIATDKTRRPTTQDVQAAMSRVKQQPFSQKHLNELIAIETKRKQNPTLLAYLTEREKSLKGVLQ